MSNQNQNLTRIEHIDQLIDLREGSPGFEIPQRRLQSRGNDATPSSTSGMSDIRTHQSCGIGNGKTGGTPDGGLENMISRWGEMPVW
jgi:hypothetical protein